MKDLKGGIRGSVFPVKLLMAYIVTFSAWITVGFWIDFGDFEQEIEGWNSTLEFSLILCIPLLWVIYTALRYSRRMPLFAAIMGTLSLWHIGITLIDYWQEGFDDRFTLDLQLLNCLIASLFWAAPFVIIYLAWRFWPRTQAGGLPAN